MGEHEAAKLVDFHCHLDLYPDHQKAVQDAERAEVFTLAVTTTPRAWARNHELSKPTKYVRAALGLHPQLVGEYAHELDLWKSLLSETRYVGEVGLDAGPRYHTSIQAQQLVFESILRCCAVAGNKIITVHSVRAVRLVLDQIERIIAPTSGRVVLHWFTGTKAEARRAVDLGCYFSVNRAMLSNDRHRSMVLSLPLDRVLTETDGPFTKTADRPSQPSDVGLVVDALGKLHQLPSSSIAIAVEKNLRSLLGQG